MRKLITRSVAVVLLVAGLIAYYAVVLKIPVRLMR